MNLISRELPSQALKEDSLLKEINAFKEKMDFVPDQSNKEACIKLANESRKLFTAIEETRKIIKQPSLDEGREIDSISKSLSAKLEYFATPFWEFKKQVAGEEKLKKQQFEESLQKRIDEINQLAVKALHSTADEVKEKIDWLTALELTEGMYHRAKDALTARLEALNALKMIEEGKRNSEALVKLQKEVASKKEQEEQEERNKVKEESEEENEVMPWHFDESEELQDSNVKSTAQKIADWLDTVALGEIKSVELVNILAGEGIIVKRNNISMNEDDIPY